jgi:predicted SnoaL-like aldol condensation-catalyzing enzyme
MISSKKKRIHDLLKGIETGDEQAVAVVNEARYIQHNPRSADGIPALRSMLESRSNGELTLSYHRIHRVLAEGNFVLCVSEGSRAGVHSVFYDLYRVAGGRIVEHWDTVEAVPPASEWKNDIGKFWLGINAGPVDAAFRLNCSSTPARVWRRLESLLGKAQAATPCTRGPP